MTRPYSRLTGLSGFRPRIGGLGKLYAGMTGELVVLPYLYMLQSIVLFRPFLVTEDDPVSIDGYVEYTDDVHAQEHVVSIRLIRKT